VVTVAPPRFRFALGAGAAALGGSVLLLGAQARWTVRRRDLPVVAGCDASGVEGADDAPLVRIAALGDSTLTGPGLGHGGEVWVRGVARLLAAHAGVQVEVRSFAVEGARVADVVARQLEPALSWKPDLVITAVGTNDAVHVTPLARVERSFERLVGALCDGVAAVVVGGVGDLGGIARVPFPLTVPLRARGRRVDRVIRAVVDAHPVHYIDVSSVDTAFRSGGRSLFSPDLFHPNELGHALWAQAAGPMVLRAACAVVPLVPPSRGGDRR
jgi:lysophospholipase L1-like esterase